jgi:hypothetical protein
MSVGNTSNMAAFKMKPGNQFKMIGNPGFNKPKQAAPVIQVIGPNSGSTGESTPIKDPAEPNSKKRKFEEFKEGL